MIGSLGAILVCVVWLRFLRSLDVFEPEHWRYTLLATFLGALATLMFILFSVLFPGYTELIIESGDFWTVFLNQAVYVALPEEITKFVPLLVMIKNTNQVDEPYDFMKYAMCSALGFATIENILYYEKFGPEIIDSRAYLSVLGHLAFTGNLAYGYIRQHYLHRGVFIINFVRYVGVGVSLHALFNTLLTMQHESYIYTMMFAALAYFLVVMLRNYINIALNFSPWFSEDKVPHIQQAFIQLSKGLFIIFLFTAIAVFLEFGLEVAWQFVVDSMMLSGTLILLIPRIFSKIKLEAGKYVNVL